MNEVMQPLKEHIIGSSDKWRVVPCEYDRMKKDWVDEHGTSTGFDDYFHENFIILTDTEIKIRNERIARRKEILSKKSELLKEYEAIGSEIEKLNEESILLLKQINWEE